MKRKFWLCFLVAMVFWVSSTIVWAQSNNLTSFKKPSNPHEYEIKTLINNTVQDKVEEAHNKIFTEFNLNKKDWLKFDVSDIQKVADGKFPGVDKDAGKALLRAYYLEGIRDKYHKIGDFKPLFIIHKETNEAFVGFLHKDDTVTLVNINDYLNENEFNITPNYDASYNVWGASFLNEGLIWDETMYTIVADGFSLTDADKLDRIIVTLDIYVNGGRKDYTSETAYNDYYVSLSNTYGHPQPIGDNGHLWELICSHWGILGQEIGYNSSGDILYISN